MQSLHATPGARLLLPEIRRVVPSYTLSVPGNRMNGARELAVVVELTVAGTLVGKLR